jgi:RimJ/RimL family protein N-acetyltransferase
MPVESACEVVVRRLREEDRPVLAEMYHSFNPLGGALGLPPIDPERQATWLSKLSRGVNLVAFLEGRLAGHLALVPIGDAAELTCFVHQDFRRRGLATALTFQAVEEARRLGYRRISVFIDTHNTGARHGLLKFGFRIVWEDLQEGEYEYALAQ